MCPQEFKGGHPLSTVPVDVDVVFPEVYHHLLCFAGIEQ